MDFSPEHFYLELYFILKVTRISSLRQSPAWTASRVRSKVLYSNVLLSYFNQFPIAIILSMNILHSLLCPRDCSWSWGDIDELYGLYPEGVYRLWNKSYWTDKQICNWIWDKGSKVNITRCNGNIWQDHLISFGG